ncbi:MAG: tetratricopeptide repeat protein, partial [bacterium]
MRAIPQNLSIIVVDKLPRWSDNRVVWKYEADGFWSIFGTECLRKGSKMCAESREFVDAERQVTKEWYDLIERAENLGIEGIKMEALKLIKKDPDFLDPYTLLFEILEDEGDSEGAEAMLDEAYTRAVRLITDKDGNWPDSLEWGYPENRHIIRALINKGLWLWSNGENEDALAIFR